MAQAEATEKVMRPENKNPPRVSDFNPQGDRDFPRPELKYKFRWIGIDLQKSQLTREECLLLNALAPGDRRVTKADGTRIPLIVEHRLNTAGRTESVWIMFPAEQGEQQQNHMPMRNYLRECVKQQENGTQALRDIDADLARTECDAAQAVPVPA